MRRNYFASGNPKISYWLPLTVAALIFLLVACGQDNGGIFPQDDGSLIGETIYGQPVPLTFASLQADPAAYRDTQIIVSGAYTPLTPTTCAPLPQNGPLIGWGLITDQLRLDAANLDDILTLVPQGTQVTVEGVWRLYVGPVGCGKEPAYGSVWYLEALQIVQPNPLPFAVAAPDLQNGQEGGADDSNQGGDELPQSDDEQGNNGQTVGQGEPTATTTITVIGSDVTPTVSATDVFATSTLNATVSLTGTPTQSVTPRVTQTGTSPPLTATITNTPPPGASLTPTIPFPTNTPPSTSTPFVTATAGPSPTPGPSLTPSNTPNVTATPIPTNTPQTYPNGTWTPDPYS